MATYGANQRRVLEILSDGKPRTVGEIANEAGTFDTPIGTAVKSLERAGRVVRCGERGIPGYTGKTAAVWRLADERRGNDGRGRLVLPSYPRDHQPGKGVHTQQVHGPDRVIYAISVVPRKRSGMARPHPDRAYPSGSGLRRRILGRNGIPGQRGRHYRGFGQPQLYRQYQTDGQSDPRVHHYRDGGADVWRLATPADPSAN